MSGAMVESWPEIIEELIRGKQFTHRPLTFIPESSTWISCWNGYFFKIVKPGSDLGSPIKHPEDLERISKEYERLVLLSEIDEAILKPVAFVEEHACLVTRQLKGLDLRGMVLLPSCRRKVQVALEEGAMLCARLHKNGEKIAHHFHLYNYEHDRFLPANQEESTLLASHPRTIVIGGFEIRNLKFHDNTESIRFFDPHQILIGAPEEDFSRYILSILMINWGKHIRCFPWRKFDLNGLVEAYESTRGVRLHWGLLTYMFTRNIAMRRFHANQATHYMPLVKKACARLYLSLYFKQVTAWRRASGM